jgi:ectoine hydroxylase-related dioxygenase (phytanoyl-CoA dioxygenase family)
MEEMRVGVLNQVDIEGLRRHLADDGYAVVRDVVSKDKLADLAASLTDEYERRKRSGELFQGGGSLSGHLNCFPGEQSRFVYDDLRDYGITELARAVEPGAEDEIRITMNWNLPGSVAQHYHSDGLFTEAFLVCNIAVVDTDLVNGAIDVLPGTNQRFYKFYEYALQRKYKLTTRLPMQRGDILLRMSTLWHRGMPNKSAAPRPMMSVTFGEAGAPEGDPFMVNDGEVVFYPNWFSTSRLGRLRERMFVAAPISYSGYRFVRSLYGNKGYSSW